MLTNNPIEQAIQPLLDTKAILEADIKATLEKVAIKRKRLEAVVTTLDILRTTDESVAQMPVPVNMGKRYTIPDVDLETFVEEFATGKRQFSRAELCKYLTENNINFTRIALDKIFRTSQYEMFGKGHMTAYRLVKAEVAGA